MVESKPNDNHGCDYLGDNDADVISLNVLLTTVNYTIFGRGVVVNCFVNSLLNRNRLGDRLWKSNSSLCLNSGNDNP